MKPPILAGIILVPTLIALAAAQWQIDPRTDGRAEPIYPSKPYSFRSTPPNYDPFQFNWNSGQWDYVPIPYDQPPAGQAPSPYRFNWSRGRWDYRPWDAAQPGYSAEPDQGRSAQPDDSPLWHAPTTRPASNEPPKVMKVDGRLVGLKAVTLSGTPRPDLLLRVRDSQGKTITVDAGQQLELPEPESRDGVETVTAIGKSGDIDGYPVLFADQVSIGSHNEPVVRDW